MRGARMGESRRQRSPSLLADRRGMTLVELLIVMVIISIVVAVAQPNLQKAIMKARASAIIGDLQVVRVAVLSFQADTNRWPADRSGGTVPPDLVPYLPAGFSFSDPLYTLDYDNWSATGPFNVGVSITTPDRDLGWTLLDMLGQNAWAQGETYSWIIEA